MPPPVKSSTNPMSPDPEALSTRPGNRLPNGRGRSPRAERALSGGSILGAQVVRMTHDDDAGEFEDPQFLGTVGRVPETSE